MKNYAYTGNNTSENERVANGFSPLTGMELSSIISNKTIYGDYPMGYKFIANIYQNGITNGINNIGTMDQGRWKIDLENHTLQLAWENAWVDTTTRAYEVNGTIEFYDIESGKWRTTFKIIESLKNGK